MTKAKAHHWQFRTRFRRHAFGWKSQPAIVRVKEAVSEIKKVARKDKVMAAEGAVLFLEKVSPALEHVDSSSGAIGTAVNNAIAAMVDIIAAAPVGEGTRDEWLERLFEAHSQDAIPYIEILADFWGELCTSPELASCWADRLIGTTRKALSPVRNLRGHFHGTSACLSALYAAGRYDDLLDVLKHETFWPYKRWAMKALAAQGKKAEAIRCAEDSRSPWASDIEIDQLCEEILLSSGFVDEAYQRYGLRANRAGTYLAWFRAVVKKYPQKRRDEILEDLVSQTPGEEGKWFAAAKNAKLFDEAIALANRTPCAPQTLVRAARDFAESNPEFAMEAGMAALRWLVEGHGYEITGLDVLDAYSHTMKAAENVGRADETTKAYPRPRRQGDFRRALRDSGAGPSAWNCVMARRSESESALDPAVIEAALDSLNADELRGLIRETILWLDESTQARLVNVLVERAARNRSGWVPAGPSEALVADIVAFAEAAKRIAYAEPFEVDDHLQQGLNAFLSRNYGAALRIFRALLVPMCEGKFHVGQDEVVEEVLAADVRTCAAQYVVSVYMTATARHRGKAVHSAIDEM